MTTQLAYKGNYNLRDDHWDVNPVTGLAERFMLLGRSHYRTEHATDQWFPSTGGSFSAAGSLNFASIASFNNADPFGTNNACLVQTDTSNTVHYYKNNPLTSNGAPATYRNVPTDTGGIQWGFQHLLKAGTTTVVDVFAKDVSGVEQAYRFDLSAGTRTSGPDNKVRIKPATPGSATFAGWYRIYSAGLRCNAVEPSNPFQTRVAHVKAGTNSFVGTGAENFYTAGFKTEYNVGACSPLPYSKPFTDNAGMGFYGESPGEDQCFVALPSTIQTPQPLTVFMEWLEYGNAAMAGASVSATTPGIFRIGDLANTANNYLKVTQTATGFTGVYSNGASTSTSTVALTVDVDDLVSLRAVLNDAGALTLYASGNGAVETTGSTGTAVGFPAAWGDNFITPNSHGLTNTGDMALRKLHVLPGAVDISVLRDL